MAFLEKSGKAAGVSSLVTKTGRGERGLGLATTLGGRLIQVNPAKSNLFLVAGAA